MTFDSNEEKFFYDWLLELQDNNLATIVTNDRKTFSICDEVIFDYEYEVQVGKKIKVKTISKKLIKEKHYTPDFIFSLREGMGLDLSTYYQEKPLTDLVTSPDGLCYVDVKGAFTRNLTSSITFADRQAMMLDKHDIYINKVIPYSKKACLFKNTFYPKSFILDQIYKVGIKKGTSKIVGDVKTIDDFIKNI